MSDSGRTSRFSRSKNRRSRAQTLSPSLPDRLKPSPNDDDTEDVTAPPGQQANYNLNQSVFQMITAASARVDQRPKSESENDDDDDSDEEARHIVQGGLRLARKDLSSSLRENLSSTSKHVDDTSRENKLSQSLSKLRLGSLKRGHKSRPSIDQIAQTTSIREEQPPDDEPPAFAVAGGHSEKSPTTSPDRMTTETARSLLQNSVLGDLIRQTEEDDADNDEAAQIYPEESESIDQLSKRLQNIFSLPEAEEVISEYPCWLLDSVLLEGHMYITTRHICFYAYMPKKQNAILKSGHLQKRGKNNPRYRRYWFILKGDVISYYTDASELYFPSGNIDLHYAIEARLLESKDPKTPTSSFQIETSDRIFNFRADSSSSAAEWVKALQKVIFRSHNDGDSKKTAIPLENVLDVEESPVLEFAHTFKLRAFHDETFAIDEYFFSFFNFGKDAYEIIRLLVEDTPAQRASGELLEKGIDIAKLPIQAKVEIDANTGNLTPVINEAVKDTLLAPPSPGFMAESTTDLRRLSLESRRSSTDVGRDSSGGKRSSSNGRDDEKCSSSRNGARNSLSLLRDRDISRSRSRPASPRVENIESWSQSVKGSSITASSDAFRSDDDDEDVSASKLLSGSDIFESPTLQGFPLSLEDRGRRSSVCRKSNQSSTAQFTAPTTTKTHAKEDVTNAIEIPSVKTSHEASMERKSSSLQDIVKVGSYPLKQAVGLAGWMKRRSQRVGEIVSAESFGYIEKVSDMWTGGKHHYDEHGERIAHGVSVADADADADMEEDEEEGSSPNPAERFRQRFALPKHEKLLAAYFGYLYKGLPVYGKIYLGSEHLCFRPMMPGAKIRMMILPLKDIENVDKERGFRFGFAGLVITIKGHQEEFFEFSHIAARDDCGSFVMKAIESLHQLESDRDAKPEMEQEDDLAKREHNLLQEARFEGAHGEHDMQKPYKATVLAPENSMSIPPIIFDDPHTSIVNFKPTESLRITCLTIGSRGDVQPYIALCKGLMRDGHHCKIATHAEFKDWVESYGIEFATVDGDPAELMRICVENGMFTYSFLKEATSKFRGWIDDLLASAWVACQNSDLLIESPSAMAGLHIAEALRIPYFRAFTMPWTRTRAYPHAFAVPEHKMGGAYNYFSYVMFDNIFWKAISGQVNRWRKTSLGLRSTNLAKMNPNKVPFLYNFSPAVVVPPLDFSDWVRVTGYWFLDESQDYEPPEELLAFIKKAREDDKKIVYVGFGSIVVADPAALTQTVVDSILNADVRCILSKGWSDRLGSKDSAVPEVPLPPEVLSIKATPHDWLFRQVDAAVHHGGAGTTGASLRAGIPTIIKPFFGDQFFFGGRVEDLGVGICMKKLNVSLFSRALWEATQSTRMRNKAKLLGEQIRSEDGVGTAIEAIYRDMEYARTLIPPLSGGIQNEPEEPWTMIDDNGSDGDNGTDTPVRTASEQLPFEHSLLKSRAAAQSHKAVTQ